MTRPWWPCGFGWKRIGWFGKSVAQWSPDFDSVSGFPVDHSSGQLADDNVAEVDPDRVARVVDDGVIEGEGATEQRVVAVGFPDHEELARENLASQFGAFESQAVGVLSHADLFQDAGRLLAGVGDLSGEL